ncbi:GSCFA domain-containing protein [Wenxinia saemankumensis]|uniref:GSCFA family protein n=1 Tax=Wenxinia saemankumensis TaxID=1447782 RepID=A0A1M6CVV7_9RHOB|nr:GSCFA domain-containing protein [Wenxinia saemankumensis]SHI65147.1 GSCFA family protein [Wenxinia saemankumensis]
MSSPYDDLPPEAFWKTGVVEADRAALRGLYRPRHVLTRQTAIATAGSCFAQHIARALRAAGANVLDAEPAPRPMPAEIRARYGYDLFSARTGNVYTARQLRQLLEEVADGEPDSAHVWEEDGRHFDALRPNVEPDGLATVDEVLLHRDYHLARTSRMLQRTEVLIFTLGLTEAWADRASGRVYPVAPGVVAGRFDPARHVLRVFRQAEVLEDLAAIRKLLHRFRRGMRLLLTVSPVPLTATARPRRHVLDATAEAKATLRSAVAEFVADHADADYFPSYELVTHPALVTDAFAPNLRSVRPEIVERVMAQFLQAHGLLDAPSRPDPATAPDDAPDDADGEDEDGDDLVCDELLLQAFAPGGEGRR